MIKSDIKNLQDNNMEIRGLGRDVYRPSYSLDKSCSWYIIEVPSGSYITRYIRTVNLEEVTLEEFVSGIKADVKEV